MNNYVDLSNQLTDFMTNDFELGPKKENGLRNMDEKLVVTIRGKLKVVVYSNEIERPHFSVELPDEKCRFDLLTGEPIDIVPPKIRVYIRNIKDCYNARRDFIIKCYRENLADTAPPQARV